MRLPGTRSELPQPDARDVPTLLAAAASAFGHRPAITVLRPDRRDEQGHASLLKWASKGAHLLQIECGVLPGARVRLLGPPAWISAAVAYAAWWVGAVVTDAGDADVHVLHEPVGASTDVHAYGIGDAFDGSPSSATGPEPWPVAVQAFPDQPPPPDGGPSTLAIDLPGLSVSHSALLEEALRWGDEGTLGVTADAPAATWLPALVRPLVTGSPTVVVAGVDPSAAEKEGVRRWA